MGQDKRYLGIEALRFLCAIAVVFWHYQHFAMGEGVFLTGTFQRELQPLYGPLRAFYDYGYMSVSIFWEISGFIFFWKYHEAVASGAVSSWRFFVLRFSRLYPLHVATLFGVAALQLAYGAGHGGQSFVYTDNDLYHFGLNLAFASAWGFEHGMSFNGPIWSVSVEVVIYAVFYAVSRMIRVELLGRIALVAAALAIWLINYRFALVPGLRVPLSCAVYFFTGGVVHAVTSRLSVPLLRGLAPFAIAAAFGLAALTFRGEVDTPKWAVLAFATLLFGGFLGLDLWPWIDRLFAKVAPLADTTYSSYLIHFPIQLAAVTLTDRLGWSRTVYDNPLVLIAFLAAVFGSGWVIFHRFERPTQDWLRARMLARPKPRAADGLA